ncbi:GntR family transcriptional regulator [Actinophytocola gossypii]|uniref:GntR family transcriptional regulator n=1 Tax=Actinophytocola gossypii TaxID=2812003 RepID=A0ABT2J5D4_9PSEU|nr:GntR family transcriptional regulator [Actinophytocola gossypii]MCT2582700.1 GntR family transcriptional regulator [Actinophytocola gossypii]
MADLPLGEHAYRTLRGLIVSLRLPPGTSVSEQGLTSAYGLSKAPVRAALVRLRAEGLVTSVPRRGHVVSVLTLRDVDEVFRLRLLLEPEAAALAAGNVDPAEVADLSHDLDQARRSVPDSFAAFVAANRRVHVRVAEASGNTRLARTITGLLDEAERAIHLALAAGAGERGLRVHHEHAELLAALTAPDPEAARRHMTDALSRFHHELVTVLRTRPAVLDAAL